MLSHLHMTKHQHEVYNHNGITYTNKQNIVNYVNIITEVQNLTSLWTGTTSSSKGKHWIKCFYH